MTLAEFERAFDSKRIALWVNRKRLNLLDYTSETPIIKESHLHQMTIPKQVKSVEYDVHLSELEREDNLLMTLNGITDIEDSFF